MAKSKLIKKFMLFGYVAIIAGVVITIWGAVTSIHLAADTIGDNAANAFHKDRVESLLLLLDSDRYSLKDKNDAIWALGVLKDKRALNKLESLSTGEACEHEKKPCRREIKKSILKIQGKFIAAWPPQSNHQ
jgi:hypothetical protein